MNTAISRITVRAMMRLIDRMDALDRAVGPNDPEWSREVERYLAIRTWAEQRWTWGTACEMARTAHWTIRSGIIPEGV